MQKLAAEIVEEVTRAAAVFRGMSEDEVTCSRGEGKWIKKQILGHLIDSALNNHQRFVRAQFSDHFIWPGYDQVEWVGLHQYERRGWSELVCLWEAVNRHIAAVIAAVLPERLSTPCTIGDLEPRPLEWWMRDYLRHTKHHIAQLEEA